MFSTLWTSFLVAKKIWRTLWHFSITFSVFIARNFQPYNEIYLFLYQFDNFHEISPLVFGPDTCGRSQGITVIDVLPSGISPPFLLAIPQASFRSCWTFWHRCLVGDDMVHSARFQTILIIDNYCAFDWSFDRFRFVFPVHQLLWVTVIVSCSNMKIHVSYVLYCIFSTVRNRTMIWYR